MEGRVLYEKDQAQLQSLVNLQSWTKENKTRPKAYYSWI